MAVGVSVVHQIRGGDARELTGEISGLKLSQAAVGGFGSAEFSMAGDKRNRLGYLGIIKCFHGSSLLWEGQLEDQGVTFDEATRTTHVRAFGLRRKFDETSVRRIWSKRDIPWSDITTGAGLNIVPAIDVINNRATGIDIARGSFDITDLTKTGLQYSGNGTALASSDGAGSDFFMSGLTFVRIMCDIVLSGANTGAGAKLQAYIGSSSDGSNWTGSVYNTSGAVSQALVAGANRIRACVFAGGGVTPAGTDKIQYSNVRVLGTALTEDAAGGFYGGTILRDLIALCPELTLGIIEDGSDYTIQALERAGRDTTASVRDEIVGYYTREWAVWEDGRFDWKTRNLDEPQWIVSLSELSQLTLDASVDDLARTVYVLYTDAASGLDTEASASSTDQRNPYLRQGKTKDTIVNPGFPMTANTSQQLATRIAGDVGARPSVGGTCVIAADRLIRNAVGEAKPAALIRAGENISFPELPKTDVILRGRDGETLFHVASVELDVDNNTVTLTLEGQQRRTDVILARLALATRVLTG